MQDFKYLVTIFSVSFIIYGVVLLFTPAGKMGKFFNSVVGVALVAVVVLTISKVDISKKTDLLNFDQSLEFDSSSYEDLEVDYIESNINSYLKDYLKQKGLSVGSVKVCTNISKDRDISISKIEVNCNKEDENLVKAVLREIYFDDLYLNGVLNE